MACHILIKKYTTLNSNSRFVATLLWKEAAKWQRESQVAMSANTALLLARPKHSHRQSSSSNGLGGDFSQPVIRCDRHSPWLSDIRHALKSAALMLVHGFGMTSSASGVQCQHQKRHCYCTQPRGDGSGSMASAQAGENSTEVQLSQKEKLKRAVKEYGSTVIIFHITISLASLGGFYLAVSSGIDMVGILKSVGVGEAILQSKLATGTGTFVVAYAVHKVFAPVRIGITLTATPLIVRYLRSKGVLKLPKPKA